MKYQDYNPFLNILELFGILLPGTITTMYLLAIDDLKLKDSLIELVTYRDEINNFLLGLLFLLASYFFGHVIFQLGSYLDDLLYKRFKDVIYDHKELSIIKKIRNTYYAKESSEGIGSNFYWCYLQLEASDNKSAFNEVQSLMAQSKFFRAIFVISMGYLILGSFYKNDPVEYLLLAIFVIFIFSFCTVDTHLNTKLKKREFISYRMNFHKQRLSEFRYASKWILLCTLFFYLGTVGLLRMPEISFPQFLTPILLYTSVPLLSLHFYFKIRYKSIKTLYKQIIFQNRHLPYDK